jgi:VWFA-related protein
MVKKSILAAFVIAAIAYAIAVFQINPVQAPDTIRLNVNLTLVHAAVLDRSGQFVSGLGKTDFQLFVDGAPRPITVFERDDAPVAAGILVDNSASMISKGPQVIAAALSFARSSNPQDEMFVVHFSDQLRLGLPPAKPFTGNIAELETALSRFSAAGTTALYDAVAFGISQLGKAVLERKVLLIISDGGDNSSQQQFGDVLKSAQEAGIVIYCVGIYDDADLDQNPRVLTEFAELTGGKAFFPSQLKEVTETCVRIAGIIRQQYTLGFAGAEDGDYHRIKITASDRNHGELDVRTRAGYFAPKP